MKHNKNILVAGELNVDLILNELDDFPQLGKEILANRMLLTLGSSSAIFACNLSVLGAPVSFCGCVGKDAFGAVVLKDLDAKGVDVTHVKKSDTTDTGITIAFSYKEDRAMVTVQGAMKELREHDITDSMLEHATHLHVSSIFLQPGLKPDITTLFNRAKRWGLTTSFDPQWDPAEKWDCAWEELLPYVDVFFPNLSELKQITQKNDLYEAIEVIKAYSNTIVVKNGHEGAIICTGDDMFIQPAFVNKNVADAIGAGDSFNAGFIHHFVQGKPLPACAEFGALCGAINTTQYGGTAAFSDYPGVKQTAFQQFNYTIHDDER